VSNEIYANHIKESLYNVNGKVIFCSEGFVVLDIGILVYCETKELFEVNKYLNGKINLGIDPYFYFEYGYKRKGIPPLIYSWTLTGLLIETAPFIESILDTDERILIRDPAKLKKIAINSTNAWYDDNGSASYLLICKVIDLKPAYKLVK
jgi:hypothetical protein